MQSMMKWMACAVTLIVATGCIADEERREGANDMGADASDAGPSIEDGDYDPCEGLACGDDCNACPPGTDCDLLPRQCNIEGDCVPMGRATCEPDLCAEVVCPEGEAFCDGDMAYGVHVAECNPMTGQCDALPGAWFTVHQVQSSTATS